ncbi:MAG: DUF2171 domain-containing protein [Sphingosinicella sp.]|uniref:DUF2171 domain-containing protein n=1 Tax=Sphingosinicella sp. TaxID=1917971 RepID=UPI0040380B7F
MAYDDRYSDQERRRREARREPWGERETAWRGDASFGGGWGNQIARPQRLGDRSQRDYDDPHYGEERYGAGEAAGYGARGHGGPEMDSDLTYGGPGFDASFGTGPRFDRADVGSIGTHGVHQVASASSPAYGFAPAGWSSSARAHAIRARDPHYREWRRRQIEALDRDYDEYHREHQSRFDREFGAWRERRGAQREALGRVSEHMEVVGSDGAHVGTVDCTRGDDIVLAKSDENAGGVHHHIPCGWVDNVDDKVKLNLTAEEAMKRWREEGRSRALFERPDSGSRGPHMLNRSFSGTYDEE